MATPTATFAIPCYDAGPHLRPLLESLLAQTRQDFALLLVDDASADGSAALAREIVGDRIAIHRNPERLGIGANWNRCAELVDTPYFCLAHMDDVYAPDFLERVLGPLEARPDAGFAHCRAVAIDAAGSPFDSAIERYKDAFWAEHASPAPQAQFALLRKGNFVACPTAIYRREVFARVGPFDTSLRFALDWQHHLRMVLAGAEVVAIREPLLRYRRHARSATTVEVASLDRYREEAAVIRWLEQQGQARGWVSPASRPSRALRNNLLHDAWADLQSGRRDQVAARLRFARDEAPEFAWDAATRAFALLTRAGAPGRAAIATALSAILWRAGRAWRRSRPAPGRL